MAIERVQDWPILLDEYIRDHLNKPFTWGDNDCCLFACTAVQILTGIDPAESWRGKYTSREAALHLAQVRGCNTVYDIAKSMAAQYGFEEIMPGFASRGDIVCHTSTNPNGLGQTLAVVGAGVCYGPGDNGLIVTQLGDIITRKTTKAWKIG